ncbi:uncharacterized protein LOC143174619 isoform X2 [Nomia melanderi]|uniref:uncharacterized protein LOC143174619 isoform X2 n=1 Tax=Nomia melanderi TaxID=2448451 RepID=UPI003FCE97BC
MERNYSFLRPALPSYRTYPIHAIALHLPPHTKKCLHETAFSLALVRLDRQRNLANRNQILRSWVPSVDSMLQ